MLNLAELVALRKDLIGLKKVLYFHENQLVYPNRFVKDRDFQFGWNQIMSALTADIVLFNSLFNLNSFLAAIPSFLKTLPEGQWRPKGIDELIRKKSTVLYFPIEMPIVIKHTKKEGPLHILWNHRWEFDKRPDLFFEALFKLKNCGCQFKLSVLGESFVDSPPIFEQAKEVLSDHILNWGYQETKDDYYQILEQADVVVSTTDHEFFGVSVVEAIARGCYPLCPNRLVFPEYLSADEHLFNTTNQLAKKLKFFASDPARLRGIESVSYTHLTLPTT
eukprot:TRINITY_DN8170_c0_g1_i2.p1 TRINITY_DN8170_c0_g1~~TRINITY_DN8170_c0_g1_i2.p1  ORF type:complete len:277 (-),score=48.98 TRINITY_DN8170_c0_g1_i2:21-851(-)